MGGDQLHLRSSEGIISSLRFASQCLSQDPWLARNRVAGRSIFQRRFVKLRHLTINGDNYILYMIKAEMKDTGEDLQYDNIRGQDAYEFRYYYAS
jgi:hypothetical protein